MNAINNIYNVIMRTSHCCYAEQMDSIADEYFYKIISNRKLSVVERADLLLGGTQV